MARNVIDVSKNWLMPIEDVMHSDVMKRRLNNVLGLRDAAGVPGYVTRVLKEQDVYYLLQLLAMDRRKFIEKSPRANMEEVLDCAELAILRLLKDEGIRESVWIGKYKKFAGDAVPTGKTEQAYKAMEDFIVCEIYNRMAVIPSSGASNNTGSVGEGSVEPELSREAMLEEMRVRWKGPQKPKLAVKKQDKKVKKTYGESRRGITRTSEQRRSDNQGAKEASRLYMPKPKTQKKALSLTSIQSLVSKGIKQEQDQEYVKNFCKARNIHVVEQICALEFAEVKDRFPLALRRVFSRALNKATAGRPGVFFSSFSTAEDRESLGMKFSEKAGFYVFPKDREAALNLVTSLLKDKGLNGAASDTLDATI